MLDCICTSFTLRGSQKRNLNSFLEGEEGVRTDVLSSEDFLSVDAVSGASMDENLPVNKRSEVILSHSLFFVHLNLPRN